MPAETAIVESANSIADSAPTPDAVETTTKEIAPVSRAVTTTTAADKEELTADSPSINAFASTEAATTEGESTTKEADETVKPTPTKDTPVVENPVPTTTHAPVTTTAAAPIATTTHQPIATTTLEPVVTTTQAVVPTTTQAAVPTTTKAPVASVPDPVASTTTTVAAIVTTPPVAVSTTPAVVVPTSVQNVPSVVASVPGSSIGVSFTAQPSATSSGLLPSNSAAPSTGGGTNSALIGGIVGGIAGAAILIALIAMIVRRKRRNNQDTRASRAMDEIFAPTSGAKGYGYSGNHTNEEAAVGAAWESPRATERVAGNGQMASDYGNNGMGYDAGHHQQGGAAYYDGGYAQQQGYEDPYRAAPQSYAPQLSEQAFNQASPALSYNNLPASAGPEGMAAGGIAMTHLDHRYRQQDGAYYADDGLQEPYQHVNRVNEHDYQTYQDSVPSSAPGVPSHDVRGMTQQPMYADPGVQHQQYDDYQYNGGNYGHDNYYQEQPYDQHHYGAADQEMYGGGNQGYQSSGGNPAYTSHPLPANPVGAGQYNDYPQQPPSGYSQPTAPKSNNQNPGQSPA